MCLDLIYKRHGLPKSAVAFKILGVDRSTGEVRSAYKQCKFSTTRAMHSQSRGRIAIPNATNRRVSYRSGFHAYEHLNEALEVARSFNSFRNGALLVIAKVRLNDLVVSGWQDGKCVYVARRQKFIQFVAMRGWRNGWHISNDKTTVQRFPEKA